MIKSIFKICNYNKSGFTFLIALCLMFINTPSAHAVTENLIYDYDDERQIREVTYEDNTTVDYSYDTSGNRLSKDTAISAHSNDVPDAFSNTSPPNNGPNPIGLPVTLIWETSTDPNAGAGDVVSYDIYLGTAPSPPLIVSGHQTTTYEVDLEPGTLYYWHVVARDNHNATKAGPEWSFTTDVPSVRLVADFSAFPNNVIGNVTVYFTDISTSYNNSITEWQWDLDGDGTIDSYEQNPSFFYNPITTTKYTIKLTVIDAYGRNDFEEKIQYLEIFADFDGDEIGDENDNCPNAHNPDQVDTNGDGEGDACDADMDGDYELNVYDNCMLTKNSQQKDHQIDPSHSDGIGDACDPDTDGDGVDNDIDVCLYLANDNNQADSDGDGYGDACTNYECVSTSAELQLALTAAVNNGIGDVIQLVQGTYSIADNNNASFLHNGGEAENLVIKGGYTANCLSRTADPSNTILNGVAGSVNVLDLTISGAANLSEIRIDGVTVQSGKIGVKLNSLYNNVTVSNSISKNNNNPNASSAGFRINATRGKINLLDNIIEDNLANSNAGVNLSISTGEVEFLNNVVTGNTANNYGGGVYLSASGVGSNVTVTNNTITGNSVLQSSGYGGGLYLDLFGASSTAEIYNNIIWNNTAQLSGGDIYIAGTVSAYNNVYDPAKLFGTFTSEGNNINIDPLFVDAANGDYHLTSASPCIDTGDGAAPSLPVEDYEGDARMLGVAPDMGADEYYISGITYSISGQIMFEGAPVSDVPVNLSGDDTAIRVTDDSGNYRITWISDGNYTVTPVHKWYDFTPLDSAVTVSGADVTGQDFTAIARDTDADGVPDHQDNCPSVYNPAPQTDTDGDGYGDECDLPGTISGTVTDAITGAPVVGASVSTYGASYSTTTGSGGFYTLTGLENNDYIINTYRYPDYLHEYYDNVPISTSATTITLEPGQDVAGIDFTLEPDTDGDGKGDLTDNCPLIANAGQEDMDADGTGDVCDADIDGDGYNNDIDVCPLLLADNNQADTDGDGYGDACTVDICVAAGDSAGLQSALNTAQNSDFDYVIKLEQGTYNITSQLSYMSTRAHSMVLRGGYTTGCVSRVADASNTILDGGGSQNILYFSESNASGFPQHIKVEGVTAQNGLRGMYLHSSNKEIILVDSIIRDNDNGSGYYVGGVDVNATYGSLVMLNNIIENNRARYNAGLRITTLDADIVAANNIITGNKATSSYGGGVSVSAVGEAVVRILNNTIAGNIALQNGGGLYLEVGSALATVDIYNNIISGNTSTNGGDIYGNSIGTINVYNNNFDPTKVYGTFTSAGNNINAALSFVAAGYWDNGVWVSGDYHLTYGSQCIDAGNNLAPSLPTYDFDGNDRIINSVVDIGAYEYSAGDITVAPMSHDFGTVDVGSSYYQTITVTNDGTADLVISGITLPTAPFSIVNDLCTGQTITPDPASECTVETRFEPTNNILYSDSFTIESNDPVNGSLAINLSGTGNYMPIADPGGPYTGTEGQAITLDGSGSTDPEGPIALYEWDIDNDGVYEYSTTSPTQDHTYPNDGQYTINLRVTDSDDATHENTTTTNISDTSPTANFTGSPISGNAPLIVYFINNSTGYDQPLSYEWDFDNSGTTDSTLDNPSYTYDMGIYSVKLTTTDYDVSTNSLLKINYITACSPYNVRIAGAIPAYFNTVQETYDTATNGDTIQSRESVFVEDLIFNNAVSATVEGGYDCTFSTVTGVTTVQGQVHISGGTVKLSNIRISQ